MRLSDCAEVVRAQASPQFQAHLSGGGQMRRGRAFGRAETIRDCGGILRPIGFLKLRSVAIKSFGISAATTRVCAAL